MKKLLAMHPVLKIALAVISLLGSIFIMPTEFNMIAYILLFISLAFIFEGFGLKLFVKILIALFLGLILGLSGVYESTMLAEIRPVGSVIFIVSGNGASQEEQHVVVVFSDIFGCRDLFSNSLEAVFFRKNRDNIIIRCSHCGTIENASRGVGIN